MERSNLYRVLVTGSRRWDRPQVIWSALNTIRAFKPLGSDFVLVHGACPNGADAQADAWAARGKICVERYPADWDTYGWAAGPERNRLMVESRPDLVMVFIRHAVRSSGTRDCWQKARAIGLECIVYPYESYSDGEW